MFSLRAQRARIAQQKSQTALYSLIKEEVPIKGKSIIHLTGSDGQRVSPTAGSIENLIPTDTKFKKAIRDYKRAYPEHADSDHHSFTSITKNIQASVEGGKEIDTISANLLATHLEYENSKTYKEQGVVEAEVAPFISRVSFNRIVLVKYLNKNEVETMKPNDGSSKTDLGR